MGSESGHASDLDLDSFGTCASPRLSPSAFSSPSAHHSRTLRKSLPWVATQLVKNQE